MTALLLRLLVTAEAAVVILPSGWCCFIPAFRGEKPVPHPQSCCACSHKQPQSKPASVPQPIPSGKRCYCQTDSTIPKPSEPIASHALFSIPIASVRSADYYPSSAGSAVTSPSIPCSLQVLHCVWRC